MTFNDITKDTAFYATMPRFLAWLGAFSHERQGLWLPKYDLKDSVASAWSSPHLYSSVTSTMAFYPTTTAGTVHLPQLNLGGARARPGRQCWCHHPGSANAYSPDHQPVARLAGSIQRFEKLTFFCDVISAE